MGHGGAWGLASELALQECLADIYGAGKVFADGVVARRVTASSPEYRREAAGLIPPNGVRVDVAGVDRIRDEAGDFSSP